MKPKQTAQEWFDNSEYSKLSNAYTVEEMLKHAYEKGAENMRNDMIEFLLMEGE